MRKRRQHNWRDEDPLYEAYSRHNVAPISIHWPELMSVLFKALQ